MRKAMIQIPQKRFEELIKLEERVNVAVETYDIANERKEKYKKWMKEKMES